MSSSRPSATPSSEAFLGTAISASGFASGAPVMIPVERYTSERFAALEFERLWPKVWQIACTVDHVAEAGDWFEYNAGPYSVLVVRDHDGELRAFQNVCRHRGNSICQGSGRGLSELRCPYHRWSWDLSGRLREVPSRKGFGALRNEDFPLLSAQAGTWGPLVFVNLDLDAMPLAEYLEGVPADSAWAHLDEFRCRFTAVTPVEANWKVVSEGFSETYHVQGIHREMLGSLDDIDSPQRIWDRQGASYQPYGVASPRVGRNVDDQVVWDSFVATQGGRMGPGHEPGVPMPAVPDGSALRDVIAAQIRAHHATRGADLSGYSTDQILTLRQYNLFPNTTVLVTADLLSVLSSRPGPATDQAELVALQFERAATPDAPRNRPFDARMEKDGADLGFVLNQDFSVIRTMQKGLRQPGMTHTVLSGEECRIINAHRVLERYLGLGPSATLPAP